MILLRERRVYPLLLFLRDNPEKKAKMASLFAIANERGIDQGNGAVEEAITLMEGAGVFKQAGDMASSMMADSISQLKKLLPQGEALTLQIEMINEFIKKML